MGVGEGVTALRGGTLCRADNSRGERSVHSAGPVTGVCSGTRGNWAQIPQKARKKAVMP